ncbi:hypothetical protein BHE74_00028185 [Ensete ventricosum]|nr:hypothetical protein BHE74_00028185 [Ensete ventricosum]
MARGSLVEGGGCSIRLEPEDGIMERMIMHGSDDSRGWLTLGNDYGPHNHIVVCHQAPGARCDNRAVG